MNTPETTREYYEGPTGAVAEVFAPSELVGQYYELPRCECMSETREHGAQTLSSIGIVMVVALVVVIATKGWRKDEMD